MTRKLAIAISGAVSLGSYEAGVMYEVLEAIAKYNKDEKTKPEEKIEIDVITGASAGGMTACILLQQLLCQGNSLRDAYDNSLYKAWVDDVDIRQLIDVQVKDQKFSLLQTEVVEKIGETYLTNDPELQNIHPAAASTIHVGIAMSNLNGYSYEIFSNSQQGTTNFSYTRYKDQFFCVAHRSQSGEVTLTEKIKLPGSSEEISTATSWEYIREVGLSSGAFPFAFRPREIKRQLGKDPLNEKSFLYTDGGVFENEPIGLAKSLVEQIGNPGNSTDERIYLYISPGQRKSTETSKFYKGNDDLLNTGITLLNAIFNQARFQDWIMKEMTDPVYSITADDTQLIGEVFSAFSGFLEKKFRAFDYNIGRERAQKELEKGNCKNLLRYDKNHSQELQWRVEGQIKDWEVAKQQLSPLAVLDQELDQLKALRVLMREVDTQTREKIEEQLISRLRSLIALINERIDTVDQKDKAWGWIKLIVRRWIGAPLVKCILERILRLWLRRNILTLPKRSILIRIQTWMSKLLRSIRTRLVNK